MNTYFACTPQSRKRLEMTENLKKRAVIPVGPRVDQGSGIRRAAATSASKIPGTAIFLASAMAAKGI